MNAMNPAELTLLRETAGDLPSLELLDVVLNRRFGVEYQPVVAVRTADVVGYQAAARFWTRTRHPLPTGQVFARLHRNPLLLFYTELEMKKLQIARFPLDRHGGWLMLDLDVDSFMEGGQTPDNPFIELFRSHAWSERELIVNLVENHHAADADRSQRMIDLLQQGGTAVAMEDAGVRWGMFSLRAFLDVSIIKFNGLELRRLNAAAASATIDWLVSAARRIGVQTVMSGVTDHEQFEWACEMGVDCVQGRLFSDRFIQLRPEA